MMDRNSVIRLPWAANSQPYLNFSEFFIILFITTIYFSYFNETAITISEFGQFRAVSVYHKVIIILIFFDLSKICIRVRVRGVRVRVPSKL